MSTSVLFDTLLSRLDSESLRSSLIEDGEELDDELVLQPDDKREYVTTTGRLRTKTLQRDLAGANPRFSPFDDCALHIASMKYLCNGL